jgi:hypothetical protein
MSDPVFTPDDPPELGTWVQCLSYSGDHYKVTKIRAHGFLVDAQADPASQVLCFPVGSLGVAPYQGPHERAGRRVGA